MAMKKCKECGAEISKSAKVCPQCGKKQKNGAIRVILGILLVIIGIGALSTSTQNQDNNTTTSTSTTAISTSVVTKENYDKISEGMTEQEVKDLLGEPTSTSESETPGVGKMILKHYQENLSLKAIDIYFLDGKVYMKNWTEL